MTALKTTTTFIQDWHSIYEPFDELPKDLLKDLLQEGFTTALSLRELPQALRARLWQKHGLKAGHDHTFRHCLGDGESFVWPLEQEPHGPLPGDPPPIAQRGGKRQQASEEQHSRTMDCARYTFPMAALMKLIDAPCKNHVDERIVKKFLVKEVEMAAGDLYPTEEEQNTIFRYAVFPLAALNLRARTHSRAAGCPFGPSAERANRCLTVCPLGLRQAGRGQVRRAAAVQVRHGGA